MKALFIGRFQPFHIGHLKIIQEACKKYEKLIIGIGSSQYSNTFDNPFTSDERKEMIEKSLDFLNIKNYELILIPDIHNPPKWVEHVLDINSNFDVVISNNELTLNLFKKKGFKIEKTPSYNKELYSGKIIRTKISKNEQWEISVPVEVSKYIKNIKGDARIKKIYQEFH